MCQALLGLAANPFQVLSDLSFPSTPLLCSIYLMPRCPHCSKRCKTNSRLLQHMNHPSSKCIQFFDELVWISEILDWK